MATKFIQCGNCKKPVADGVKRCPYCGAKLKRHGCLKTLLLFFVLAALAVFAAGLAPVVRMMMQMQGEALNWADYRLGEALPEIEGKKGTVDENDDSRLWLTVNKVALQERNAYVDACKAEGFTIESESFGSDYTAYNREGYKLHISYYSGLQEMHVILDAPMALGTLQWPQSELAKRIPAPGSTVGKLSWEREDGFLAYVGEMPVEAYDAYVQSCADAGFTVDYDKGERYYRAQDSDGFSLSVGYEGFGVMTVRLEAPNDEPQAATVAAQAEAATEAPVTEAPAQTTQPPSANAAGAASGELIDGMRPEVKEALDAYEAFFDEYADFMEKYESSDNTVGMLLDYTKYVSEYVETMKKFEAMGDDDLNNAEMAYYLQVQMRVSQKLLEAIE